MRQSLRLVGVALLGVPLVVYLACNSSSSTSSSSGGTTSAPCDLTIPLPPTPTPANFDWQPLASNWCAQLATCGYPLANCESVYMASLATTAPQDQGDDAGPSEPAATFEGNCEQSEQAQNDASVCCFPLGSQQDCIENDPSDPAGGCCPGLTCGYGYPTGSSGLETSVCCMTWGTSGCKQNTDCCAFDPNVLPTCNSGKCCVASGAPCDDTVSGLGVCCSGTCVVNASDAYVCQ